MRKTALTAILAMGLGGLAGATTIFDAATDNTVLLNNGVADTGSMTLSGGPGNLVLTNANGSFNMGGFVSIEHINALNASDLTATDTVTLSLRVDSIAGTWRANGAQFGIVGDAANPSGTNNFLVGIEAANTGSDVAILSSWISTGLGFDAQEASVLNGFGMEIAANVAGYTITLSDIVVANSTVAGINNGATSATISGSFAPGDFVNYFGNGHLYFAAQRYNTSPATDPLVTTISEASIAVETQTNPLLAVAPGMLSLELLAPDTSVAGTLAASYSVGANSSSDIEVVSLVADAGFSASMGSTTLGLGNPDEEIIVTFNNSVGLTNLGDTTNSTLVVTWTEVGSGVTNTAEVALDVTYIPEAPSAPDHGLVVFEASTGNTTLFSNNVKGDDSNVALSGASPDLLLAVDGGDFFSGGFASTESIETLLGAALTSNDTVMISLTVDSVTHTGSSELRSRGIEFGMSAEAISSGGGSASNFVVRIGGAGNGTVI
ncbi:hypothetical protein, partial [Pontiella sp.]|uniref:hypothetical protein n=1 Tax=Pontiella sp. TaxID=2837462 RepID=UPI0035641350